MDKTDQLCTACGNDTAAAFANLRSLVSNFLRGEIQHSTFAALAGDVVLHYDMAVAHRKMQAQLAQNMESGSSGAGRHYKRDENPLHKPSCGCDWCQMEPIGNYRGNPPEDTSASENKAEG